MRVTLSPDEKEYLVRLAGLQRLRVSGAPDGSEFILEIDPETADELRDRCGEELQLHGFDKEYRPTREGRILESLIDKLFTG
jgi:hypothetical protein